MPGATSGQRERPAKITTRRQIAKHAQGYAGKQRSSSGDQLQAITPADHPRAITPRRSPPGDHHPGTVANPARDAPTAAGQVAAQETVTPVPVPLPWNPKLVEAPAP